MPNPFTPATLKFLRDLRRHNERDWFHANKPRYVAVARDPALAFVAAFSGPLEKISTCFEADPRPVGGSLFRIHRDVRFSKDKSPYKTSIGIQFRHESARDVHAPGFYLHVEPRASFVGVGLWHPAPPDARTVRTAIVADAAGWKRAARGGTFGKRFELSGERLARPPRGFDPDHPLVEDLKRKDFVATREVPDDELLDARFPATFARDCRAAAPFVKFLCGALDLPF